MNIGLPLGQNGLLAIEIDTDEPDQLKSILEALPPIIVAKRGKRGLTAFYLTSGHGIATRRLGLVEILSHGTQTVIPPSIHPATGQPYVWVEPQALEV